MKKKFSLDDELEFIPFKTEGNKIYVNYYRDEIQAGFPSPADDFIEQKLSLDERYLSHPDSTYLVRVKGNSMSPTLLEKDILIVRSDVDLTQNKIAIVSINKAAFTVKRIDINKKQLIPDNQSFSKIPIGENDTLRYLGVVIAVFRDL
ncbi:LexA family protein [Moheibacter sediminis]|uniref:DNA polymerase V n=1 Tax=Moheibacter sediminis TaxID=1434700 RepID=A0A1W2C984_9FLAO|nr:S24 family peptidase [Moheibacter sediminis]SMC81544.1 DNA polymerase V [Moheibacter sediminis]